MRTPTPTRGYRTVGVATRFGLLICGSIVSTVCYAVTIRARLGLGPLYALQDGLARHLGITIGHSVMLTGVALVLIAVGLRSWPGAGTIILPFLGGALLDALLPHLSKIEGLPARFAAVVVASWVMALGGALIIRAAVGVAALDAVMLGLHRVLGRGLIKVRLSMEATMLAVGWLLGGAVGIGTVITGVLIGPALQFWIRVVRASTGPTPAPAARVGSHR